MSARTTSIQAKKKYGMNKYQQLNASDSIYISFSWVKYCSHVLTIYEHNSN